MPKTVTELANQSKELDPDHPHASLFQEGSKESLIKWATPQQIQEVSERLTRIQRVGIHSEAKGNYFKSGDLAYEIQEIIRATAELFKKSQRTTE